MLSVLKIRNLALVDSLTWEIGSGLVCVTGETGAGKSVIVGAVKLVLGERADRSLVRTGEDACTVEALFQLSDPEPVDALLEEAGLDPCEDGDLVIRRVVTAGGSGNRQFVNGSPCTLSVLKALGHHLVDLHGPHDHQSLLSRERQLAMLDAFAGATALRDDYHAAWQAWRRAHAAHDELVHAERASEQELDLLRFQIQEIDDTDPKPGEDAETEARYRVATNGRRLAEEAGAVVAILADQLADPLAEIRRRIAQLARLDPATTTLTAGAETAAVELQELEENLREYAENLELDPAEAARLENRLDTLESLKRKYGDSLDDVLAHRDAARARLDRIENRTEELARLEAEAAAALDATRKAGRRLSKARRKAAPALAAEIAGHLAELGFRRALFEIALDPLEHDTEPAASGLETCDFLFAPNPGEPPRPLRQTASSGEMSRTMLAVKSALVKEDRIPLLIFDEIDANVGGEIAAAVGRKMAQLGSRHQVVSITHLPQVAALASAHYVVTKDFEQDRTRSSLREVAGDSRIDEIARMLGGSEASARAHAASLIAERP